MTPEDEREIIALMRAARAKARGYADFFGWSTDRDLEEWGVVNALQEALHASGALFFSEMKRRGRGNDPPDCEAVHSNGQRIAIEVTELVCGDAIQAYRHGQVYDWAEWSEERFLLALAKRIDAKSARYSKLKGGPYEGGYLVVVYTDEPALSVDAVTRYLGGRTFQVANNATRAFLLLSYDPQKSTYPYVELSVIT